MGGNLIPNKQIISYCYFYISITAAQGKWLAVLARSDTAVSSAGHANSVLYFLSEQTTTAISPNVTSQIPQIEGYRCNSGYSKHPITRRF